MKPTNMFTTTFSRGRGRLILIGALAAVMTACSATSPMRASSPAAGSERPAVVKGAPPASAGKAAEADRKPVSPQPPASKLLVYRSRNYGISFQYPWQYGFRSARAIAGGGESLRPKSDGSDGQFTLARIDLPKGFYPETDFESGFFTLSLNQNLDEQQCESALGKEGKLATDSINGADFRWAEHESGGRGSAEKVRNYATFSNGTCYELELGVKTSNPDGLARELDPDQVLRRLDGILRTVKIAPAMKDATAEASAAPAPIAPH